MSGENEKASRWLRVAVVGSVGLKLRVDLVTILVRMIANGPDGKGIKRIFPKPNPIFVDRFHRLAFLPLTFDTLSDDCYFTDGYSTRRTRLVGHTRCNPLRFKEKESETSPHHY